MTEESWIDTDAETMVLSAMLYRQFDDPRLESGHFGNPCYRALFDLIRGLQSDGVPIDLATVHRNLNGDGEIRDAYRAIASADFEAPFSTDYLCGILDRKRIARGRQEILAEDLPIAETINRLVGLSADGFERGDLRPLKAVAREWVDRLDRISRGEEDRKAIPTGFDELDAMTRGFEEARLWVLGARPRIGKTSLLCSWALHVSRQTTLPVPFFSLEMTAEQLVARMISIESRINNHNLRLARLAPDERQRLTESLMADSSLLINDDATTTPADIRESILRLPAPPAAVFVDYLQKLKAGTSKRRAENRQIEVGDISRALKDISKEFRIPVIVAAQINREGAGRPKIEHLRESGDIETEADVIALLHRADEPEGHLWDVDLIVDKNRDGAEGPIPMTFDPRITKFAELPKE